MSLLKWTYKSIYNIAEEMKKLKNILFVPLILAGIFIGIYIPAIVQPATAQTIPELFAILTEDLSGDPWYAGSNSSIEIVNLSSMKTLKTISIGKRDPTSLAVSQNGQRLYIVDRFKKEIVVFDRSTGTQIANISVTDPRDSVLSADGSTLYVTAGNGLVVIDTTTNTVKQQINLTVNNNYTLGIAFSTDEKTIGVVGTDPALYIIDTVTMGLKSRIPITNPGEPTNCATDPNDITFTNTGIALLWDSNCDNLYQVDVIGAVQITAKTIRMGRDSGSFFNYNNMLYYSQLTGKAYALKESKELAVMDPSKANGFLFGGFNGTPFVPSLMQNGSKLLISVIHRFDGGGADTLYMYDTQSNTSIADVYIFSSPSMSVRDIRILEVPQQNHAPNQPNNSVPANGAFNQQINPTLNWIGGDLDGDTVTYTVYLDTNSNPTTQKCLVTVNTCSVSGLYYGTKYYWKVTASDGKALPVTGNIWNFTTQLPLPLEYTFETTNDKIQIQIKDNNTTIYYNSPHKFNWTAGTTHIILVPGSMNFAPERIYYKFINWSGNSISRDQEISIIAGVNPTGIYKAEYMIDDLFYLTINTSCPSNCPGITILGEGLYPNRTVKELEAPSVAGLSFDSWHIVKRTVTDQNNSNPINLTIEENITAIANYNEPIGIISKIINAIYEIPKYLIRTYDAIVSFLRQLLKTDELLYIVNGGIDTVN